MSYSVVLTSRAQDDLREIFQYIAYGLQSRQNAAGQLSRLEKEIASLAQMPERFRVYDKAKWRKQNLRVMPVDNYLVFYIPTHDDRKVTVLRIIYGGRNVDRALESIE